MINLTFEGEPLHAICSNLELAEEAYGSVAAAALVSFISDALSFETADELLEFLGEDVQISPDDAVSVAIGSDYRAELITVGTRHSRDAAGRIVWSSVTRLKMLAISRIA